MKHLIVIICSLGLTACGDSGGGSAAAAQIDLRQQCESTSVWTGEWEDSALNELNINPDCTGRDDYCQASFQYYKPVNNQVIIDIKSTHNWPDCLPVGEHTCSIIHDTLNNGTEFLTLNCGAGNTQYFPR